MRALAAALLFLLVAAPAAAQGMSVEAVAYPVHILNETVEGYIAVTVSGPTDGRLFLVLYEDGERVYSNLFDVDPSGTTEVSFTVTFDADSKLTMKVWHMVSGKPVSVVEAKVDTHFVGAIVGVHKYPLVPEPQNFVFPVVSIVLLGLFTYHYWRLPKDMKEEELPFSLSFGGLYTVSFLEVIDKPIVFDFRVKILIALMLASMLYAVGRMGLRRESLELVAIALTYSIFMWSFLDAYEGYQFPIFSQMAFEMFIFLAFAYFLFILYNLVEVPREGAIQRKDPEAP